MSYENTGTVASPLLITFLSTVLVLTFLLSSSFWVSAEELQLQGLIDEALKNNPSIRAYEAGVSASSYRVSQAGSLPDPMFMFGYQNEGYRKYTYGKAGDAQWMYSLSQMFPYPGKRSLRGEIAVREFESSRSSLENLQLRTAARVKELFYDLFVTYKNIELIREKSTLLSRVEDAATALYSAGTGSQQEVLMAQTEKYMLLERERMLEQKIQSAEAMLNEVLGRMAYAGLGRPGEPAATEFHLSPDELIRIAVEQSPEIRAGHKLVGVTEAKVRLANREYYPDFTLAGSIFERQNFDDMWSLTMAVNIPLYYRTKQRQAVLESEALLLQARSELESLKLSVSSYIRDNYSMIKTAESLMQLYKEGLIPKTHQEFELALSGYTEGNVEALTVITKLKSLIDFEMLHWAQFAEREKAIARIEAVAGIINKRGSSEETANK
jgi:cobalt-zinc-cadmium efflux system outer membrane protein